MTTAVTHPRMPPRRGGTAGTWWSKAVLRAVEESAYGETELKQGRALARGGTVGAITVDSGSAVAAVEHGGGVESVQVTLPVLDAASLETLVELVAAQAGRIGALLGGELPHSFVEAVEEAGIELLPYGGELGAECTCESWLDPCAHALAVLTQVAWLTRDDPFVLTHLRGLPREEALRRLHELTAGTSDPVGPAGRREDAALETALDAAERAAHLLASLPEDRSAGAPDPGGTG